MAHYRNYMEILVEEQVDRLLEESGCCRCERCRNDVIAYALNQLPQKYVVTEMGEVYTKCYMLRTQHIADITTAIARGISIVSRSPRHDKENT